MILTHMQLRNKVKVINPGMNWSTPSKVIIIQSLKNLAGTMSVKKPTT